LTWPGAFLSCTTPDVRRKLPNDGTDELEAEVLARISEAGAAPGWATAGTARAICRATALIMNRLKLLLDKGHADAVVPNCFCSR
jgi:hypothetical protein